MNDKNKKKYIIIIFDKLEFLYSLSVEISKKNIYEKEASCK